MHIDWRLSLSGFVVGAIVGMTGMGGGSLMTALLILVFGLHPTTAVGTDLLYACATKVFGTGVHAVNRNVDLRVCALLAMGSLPATVQSIAVLAQLPHDHPVLERAISVGIGVALIIAAAAMLLRGRLLALARARGGAVGEKRRRLATASLGVLLGAVVSLTSVGSGAIGLALLALLHPAMPAVRLVGTDIAHAVPLTLIAGTGHWLIGDVEAGLLASLLAGSIPGIMVGSHFANRLPERMLTPLLAGVLALIGAGLVMR